LQKNTAAFRARALLPSWRTFAHYFHAFAAVPCYASPLLPAPARARALRSASISAFLFLVLENFSA